MAQSPAERVRRYRMRHPDKVREANRKRYNDLTEQERKDYNHQYYLRHHEARKEKSRKYREAHSAEIRIREKLRRANLTSEQVERIQDQRRRRYQLDKERLSSPEERQKAANRQRIWYRANLEHARKKAREQGSRYRKRNPKKVKEATERCRVARGARNKAYVEAYKREHPCIRCGESDPVVLDLHHRDPNEKEFTISAWTFRASIKALEVEIAKCDVLCANCHRRAHYERDQKNRVNT
jgi:hypothetical protein